MGLHIVNGAEEAKFDKIGAEFILGDHRGHDSDHT